MPRTSNRTAPGDDANGEPADRRVLAFARALGRYQALRDMAAARAAASDDEGTDPDQRAWPSAPPRPRVIDLYSRTLPSGFLPGFIAYAANPGHGIHHRR